MRTPCTRKHGYVCFSCHTETRRGTVWGETIFEHPPLCRTCGSEMHWISGLKVPKKDDKKGWDKLLKDWLKWKAFFNHRPVGPGGYVDYKPTFRRRKGWKNDQKTKKTSQ